MAIIFGSARIDENGNIYGGKAGDQTGKEVSLEPMYKHSQGWFILRPKSIEHADKMAERMKAACDNDNIGYDQYQRSGVVSNGIDTKIKTEADCSSLVRRCVIEAMGVDPTNFTTSNEATKLEATGLFEKRVTYISQAVTPVYDGDVLVTVTKGHTGIIVSGNPRPRPTPAAPTNANVDVEYQVYAGGRWLPTVVNLKDFAGIAGKPIKGFAIKRVSAGKIKYQVHTKNGWYSEIWSDNYNLNDMTRGYAGDLMNDIDAIRIYYYTPDNIRPYKEAKYRVDTVKREIYYSWQTDYDTSNGQDGYAGVLGGNAIDRVQIVIE